MRVSLVTCVFPPEPVVTAQTSHQLAVELARRGHDVTVIAPVPSRPTGRRYPGYPYRLVHADTGFPGLNVRRCWALPSSRSSLTSRLLENLSFGLTSLLALRSMPAPDVAYMNSWPLAATRMAVDYCSARRIPVLLSVQDLYPETLVIQGRLRSGSRLVKAMLAYDSLTAQRCARINLISPRLADGYARARQLERDRVLVTPNWVADDLVVVDPAASLQFRRRCGLAADDFVVVYGGSISAASGVENLVRVFNGLAEPRLRLLIAGSGSSLAACHRLAAGDPRILFHSPYTLDENATVLGAADVLVLPTAGGQALVALPSKLLSYMQSARPVIALAPAASDLADAVRLAGCGWVVEPDQPQALAEAIRMVQAMPRATLGQKGQAGRDYCLREHGVRACLGKLVHEIEALAG